MSELVIPRDMNTGKRRQEMRQVLLDDGGEGHEWAVDRLERLSVGDGLYHKTNHKVMKKFLESCRTSNKMIAKRLTIAEWQLEEWCKKTSEIELWKLRILATFSTKYNWLVFFLDDPRKMS